MKTSTVLIGLLIAANCLTSCRESKNVDRFYVEKGEWDTGRIPLIKPYEAMITSKDFGWGMNLDGKDGDTGFFNIKKVNVVNGIILVYNTNSILHGVDVKQSWHIIIPKKHIEKGFGNYTEYIDYLKEWGIETAPQLHNIDSIADYFEHHDMMNWQEINASK